MTNEFNPSVPEHDAGSEPVRPRAPESATTGARREREREQRRRDILAIAMDLFTRKGYDGTTMAEIAEAAEFAVGTLYKFFRDKQDLYQTLLAETVEDFERQLVPLLAPSDEDPYDQLCVWLARGAELFYQHLPITRVYYSQTGAAFLFASTGLEGAAFQAYGRIVAALEDAFRRGIERGKFVDIDPAVLAMCFEGVHNAFLSALVRDENSYTPAQIAQYSQQVFFGTILRDAEKSGRIAAGG